MPTADGIDQLERELVRFGLVSFVTIYPTTGAAITVKLMRLAGCDTSRHHDGAKRPWNAHLLRPNPAAPLTRSG